MWTMIRFIFFFSSRRRHTRCSRDWSSDVCSSDLQGEGEISNAEQMVAFAGKLVQKYGFRTIKYKNGVLPVDEEIETFIALRKAFPDHKIRMDPNAVWSVTTSIYVAKKLRDYDLEYLEDPTWGLRGMA